MLHKKWFNRLLFSYLPIFLIIIAAIFVLFFVYFYQFSKSEATKANSQFITYVQQTLESSLETVDQTAIALISDNRMKTFLYSTDNEDQKMATYELSRELNKIMLSSKLIDSIYVYRVSSHKVLSDEGFYAYSDFGDKAFIASMIDTDFPHYYWSGTREYRQLNKNRNESVISLVRKTPLYSKADGLLVINLNISSIQEFITEVFSQNKSYFYLTDQNNEYIAGTINEAEHNKEFNRLNQLSDVTSAYTNWRYESGLYGHRSLVFSFFSMLWVVFLLIFVMLGVILVVMQTRKNYKPIQNIVSNISNFSLKTVDGPGKDEDDELEYIQSAFDNLFKQSNEFEKRYKEGHVYKTSQCFYDLLHGTGKNKDGEWQRHALLKGFQPEENGIWIAIAEIDHYRQFEQLYNINDQGLLKFVLANVINELADHYRIPVWSEWLTSRKVGMMLQYPEDEEEGSMQPRITRLYEDICDWIRKNTSFTVTIGVGQRVCHAEDIPESYEQAAAALKYKPVLGIDRVIFTDSLNHMPQQDILYAYQTMRNIVQYIKMGKPSWEEELEKLFAGIRGGLHNRDELIGLFDYLKFQLLRELEYIPEEYRSQWLGVWNNEISELISAFDSIHDLESGIVEVLRGVFEKLGQLRETSHNQQLMLQIKSFLEENMADPNLSQTQVADHFAVKYISQLFKQETGEKFTDYMASIRIERAKKLLIETNDSVQDIGNAVGYVHSFSFIRLFKRIVGMTPGDYRAKYGRQA